MKPFAYQYLQMDYDDLDANEVRPTLRALYGYVMVRGVTPSANINVDAIYPDGTRQSFTLDERFKVKIQLDTESLFLEARRMIEADKVAWQKFTDEARARRKANGQDENAVITITGAPRLSDYSEEDIVMRLSLERQSRWKTVDEIDWAALEKELEKEG